MYTCLYAHINLYHSKQLNTNTSDLNKTFLCVWVTRNGFYNHTSKLTLLAIVKMGYWYSLMKIYGVRRFLCLVYAFVRLRICLQSNYGFLHNITYLL